MPEIGPSRSRDAGAGLAQEFRIRQVESEDIPLVTALAGHIWRRHYPSIIGVEQTEAMLAGLYALDALARQMAAGQHYLLMEDGHQQAVGFGAWSRYDPGLGGPGVTRLYLDPAWQGRGLGQRLFQALRDALSATGAAPVRLRVNRRNVQAINFYFRHGFVIERALDEYYDQRWLLDDFLMIDDGSGS